MVNPTLTYDNEYNRRLREILTNYDDIEASRNSPTMVTGGMRLNTHINSGTTPYDGREGTAQFSGTVIGGVSRPRFIDDALESPKISPITDMRYRGRVPKIPTPTRAQLEAMYNASNLSGGEMIGGRNDALHWTKFGLETALKANRLRNQARSLFGGQGKRKNRMEDATFWRDFADSTVNKGLNLGEQGKKLFGMGKGGLSLDEFGRYVPKVMLYNAINNATGRHLPSAFGGAECTGYGIPKKIGKKVGRAVSARGAVVSQVMKEHGLSLPQASKYVKEHGLY